MGKTLLVMGLYKGFTGAARGVYNEGAGFFGDIEESFHEVLECLLE